MTHLPSKSSMRVNSSGRTIAVIEELAVAFNELADYSDDDEAFVKHTAYGLLAILWGHRPWLDNLDYLSPGFPDYVNVEEFDRHDRAEWSLTIQVPVLGQVWWQAYNIVHAYGPAATFDALIAAATTGPHEDRPGFAWYVHARWVDAARTYGCMGPNPYGLIYLR